YIYSAPKADEFASCGVMSDGLVVGTYLAEQVATTSYALLAATQADAAKRIARIANSNGLRKRRLRDGRNFKNVLELPALASLDPLLSGNTESVKEAQVAHFEEQRRQRLQNIEISSTRLSQGRSTWGADREVKQRNSQAIASLTAPLPWFRPDEKDPESEKSPKSPKSPRKKRGMYATATDRWDLFDKSLRGTGVERSPKSRSPRRVELDDHDLFKLSLAEQPLLPEDPVEAYFQSQDCRIDDVHSYKKGSVFCIPDEAEVRRKRPSRPIARARVQSFRDPKAMARVASFLEGESQERRRSQQSDSLEELPERPDLLDQLSRQKMSQLRRDACQLMRMFVFGAVGNENCKTKRERESVFFESCGTKDDMPKLLKAWDKIDPDDAGRIELAQVQRFADRLMIDLAAAHKWLESNALGAQEDPQSILSRMPPWIASTAEERSRFVQKLCERLTAALSAARKPSFSLEDMMRIIWPCSSSADLAQMSAWCEEINNTRDKWQVTPPPVLPAEAKDALQAVFDYFDKDGGGKISANELVLSGLVDKAGASDFVRTAAGPTGEIGLRDFCEMLCPHGYRATQESVVGSTVLGRAARLDKTTGTWRLKGAKPIAAVRYRYSSFGRASRMKLGSISGGKIEGLK
ncbi:unnamed protein product, partial [Durusdinium trenchii]